MVSAVLLCCFALGAEPSPTQFPFLAEVVVDKAEVQANHGRSYYTTDRLKAGTIVEVHRKSVGGWFGIRPPEGSFSWIPAVQVELTDDADVAEVVAEDAVSWIGSRTDTVHKHLYTVKLKVGERVEILGEKEVAGEGGETETWYKIAPPAGEFRWISIREVAVINQRPEEKLVASPRKAEVIGSGIERAEIEEPEAKVEEPAVTFRPRSKIALSPISSPQPVNSIPDARPAAFTEISAAKERDKFVQPAAYLEDLGKEPKLEAVDLSAMERAKEASSSTDGFVPRGSRFSSTKDEVTPRTPLPFVAADRSAGNEKKEVKTEGSSAAKPSATPIGAGVAEPKPVVDVSSTATAGGNALTRTELDTALAKLDAELTSMVARDPKTWELPRIRVAAEKLIEQSPTSADRGRVRLLVEKIHQFATTFNVEDDPRFATVTAAAEAKPQVPQALDPKYDGVGWLKPVISRERPAAPYALVDSDGRPLAFVTPAPGMNLNRYLNKPLGVYGRRGMVEELNTPHIVVERVIDLGRHIR